MLEQQRTIKNPVTVKGVGLHTGNLSTLTFLPAPPNKGIWFRRVDLEGKPEIKADIEHVVDISRGTTLGNGKLRIHTVEHVLAALAGMMIDNVIIELDANEPPVMDGSALPFVKAIKSGGIVEQDSPRDYFVIEKTISYSDEKRGIDIVVFPSDEFRITFMIDYKNPALGTQYTSMYSLQDEFESEFAPARTFCFLHEVEMLVEKGLIKGGNLDNAIVIIDRKIDESELEYLKRLIGLKGEIKLGKNGILNEKPLRFKNEPVRHKTLDLIGDLALLGVPLKAHIIAARSGHAANVELVKMIQKEYEKQRITSKYTGGAALHDSVFDAQTILKILPHRYPFLLVDKIIDLIPRERVVGIKNVTLNEPYFQGHFPGHPIMPGVLILEAMAQVGGILLLNTEQNPEDKLVYFTGLDKVKFRKPVKPGDQIRFELEMIKYRKAFCRMAGKAYVAGDLVCEAELAAAVVDRN
ncbi:MAG: bifunctional UDP-3-O-[3-hydroxymyristoyl] N-acetylglucosamine deacetylase/3-hydroxyacyl-ACP dehydratase [Calditrichaeota bacterium]|nr:MAG: bifunctional UDP-3-O-[3-hydroxymyristoyl] N-acetylglucosamine deacetylase/3-hydroxyacyl-ACP dehydratase [Calditrichota bacterium]